MVSSIFFVPMAIFKTRITRLLVPFACGMLFQASWNIFNMLTSLVVMPELLDASAQPPFDVANNKLLYLAYYYPWYIRDDWTRHGHVDDPKLGLYGTDEPEVAEQHNEWAKRAGVDAWVVSWWGPDNLVTNHFRSGMLKSKNMDPIKFCLHYESPGALPTRDFANGTIAIDAFIKDMKYLQREYFSNPSYLHVNGRPVVVLYITRTWTNFTSSMLDQVKNEVGEDIFFIADEPYFGNQQWVNEANNGIRDGKPVFEAYTTYNLFEDELVKEGESAKDFMFREGLPIFERWSKETIFFPNVLPMYHDFRGHKVLSGDAAGLTAQLDAFYHLRRPSWYNASLPNMMFITSWNEWWEGTQVEPDLDDTYGFTFIDALKEFKDTADAPTPSPTPPASVSNNELLYLAYYYPWYIRDDWSRHGHVDDPSMGLYGTDEPKVAEQHNEWAKRAGVDVWVVSWWGQENMVINHFRSGMLKSKNMDPIKFCFHYESPGALPTRDFSDGTIAIDTFISHMKYLQSEYFSHPSYLHVNGRPVVVLYISRTWTNFNASMLDQVRNEVGEDIFFIADEPFFGTQQSVDEANNGIKDGKPVFEAYTTYNLFEDELVKEGESATDYMLRESLPIFESWSKETIFFPNVLPMYHDFRGHKVLSGDAAGLTAQLDRFHCLPRPPWYNKDLPDMMFVTSWNEWWEGTQVEPDLDDTYGFTFIDALKEFKDNAKKCAR
jgi:hypothetical protein